MFETQIEEDATAGEADQTATENQSGGSNTNEILEGEQTTLKNFQKKKINIGQDYHLTDKEILDIAEESTKNREEIDEQIREVDKRLRHPPEKATQEYIRKLETKKRQLEQLSAMEHALIKAAAFEIMKYGDPVDYIIKVYNRLHVGDTGIGKVMLLSIACQSVLNSEGLQPKLSGASGKGKTHAAKAMYHLMPDVGYKLEGSLSAKSLFYHPDLQAGTVVFSDDVRINDDLDDTLKRAMANFQQKTPHRTVIKGEYTELEIPERITWWMTSVDSPFTDELLNRLFGLDVDDSVDQDIKVSEQQLYHAKYGTESLPENDPDIYIYRAIIHKVKGESLKVIVPYADRIAWSASADRRNLPRFLDLIRAFATMKYMQRFELIDNQIWADIKDFEDAKALWELGKAGLTTKLTVAELRFLNWIVGKTPHSINQIEKGYMKPDGKPYIPEAIRKMLHGKKDGKGLVDKVPGMLVHGSGGKNDEKTYEIPFFDDKSGMEVVTLKPEGDNPTSQEPLFSDATNP